MRSPRHYTDDKLHVFSTITTVSKAIWRGVTRQELFFIAKITDASRESQTLQKNNNNINKFFKNGAKKKAISFAYHNLLWEFHLGNQTSPAASYQV